jgi:hypothetical protein
MIVTNWQAGAVELVVSPLLWRILGSHITQRFKVNSALNILQRTCFLRSS